MPGRNERAVTVTLSESDLALLMEAVSEFMYELTHYESPPSSRGGAELPQDKRHPDAAKLQRLYEQLEATRRA